MGAVDGCCAVMEEREPYPHRLAVQGRIAEEV